MSEGTAREIEIAVKESIGVVPGLVISPPEAWAACVLAHGAGAGMRHAFLEETAGALFARGVATLRYEFPYMRSKGRRPDPPAVLEDTVRAAVAAAAREWPHLPVVAGGKSMGGRMTSRAAAAGPLSGVRGLVFLGFPLHAPGRAGSARGAHLAEVTVPMLFIQGTRDTLAQIDLIRELASSLGSRATLHVVEGGDHSFAVLKRSGRDPSEVKQEVVDTVVSWVRNLAA